MADQQNLQELANRIEADAASLHARLKRRNVILVALIVFVFGYMSWIYNKVGDLNAEALTDIAAAELRTNLPEMRQDFSQRLIDATPDVIAMGEKRVREAIPELGTRIEELALGGADQALIKLEEDLGNELALDLAERMETLERADIGSTPEARVNAVVAFVTEDYRSRVDDMVDRLYTDYSKQMGGLNEMLVRLQTAKDLTPREKAQKDIIECSVALREHYIEPTVPEILEGTDLAK